MKEARKTLGWWLGEISGFLILPLAAFICALIGAIQLALVELAILLLLATFVSWILAYVLLAVFALATGRLFSDVFRSEDLKTRCFKISAIIGIIVFAFLIYAFHERDLSRSPEPIHSATANASQLA